MSDWWLVAGGLLALFGAGWLLDGLRRRRRRRSDLSVESARARRAIRLAETSRDAASTSVPDAERLLDRAQAMLSGVRSPGTAQKAAALAQRADRLWHRHTVAVRAKRSGGALRGATKPAAAARAGGGIDGPDVLKIVSSLLLVLLGTIFIAQQTQQPDTEFKPRESQSEGAATDPDDDPVPPVPSYSAITAEYGDAPIVTLPGAPAVLDAEVTAAWMAKANAQAAELDNDIDRSFVEVTRIVLAPPLHPDAEEGIEVPENVLLVTGTRAALYPMVAEPSDFADMARTYAASDVTDAVVSLIAERLDAEAPEHPALVWREPTEAELTPVLADLQQDGIAFVGDAEPFAMPDQALEAFPEGQDPLVVVAPAAAAGEPAVGYADAVAAAFPDRPVVTMTGLWLDFAGRYAAEFADPMRASLYGQYARRLQEFDYSQRTVLALGLDRVAQFRHSGMFAQPLPYQPPDPLRLTLPALPWICAGLGLLALIASVVQIARQKGPQIDPVDEATVHRLAGLSELAVEISGLTEGRTKASLLRALTALSEAREVADTMTEDAAVAVDLLDRAEQELDRVATALDRPEYRPSRFLTARWT